MLFPIVTLHFSESINDIKLIRPSTIFPLVGYNYFGQMVFGVSSDETSKVWVEVYRFELVSLVFLLNLIHYFAPLDRCGSGKAWKELSILCLSSRNFFFSESGPHSLFAFVKASYFTCEVVLTIPSNSRDLIFV